jgi:hypothetical protein
MAGGGAATLVLKIVADAKDAQQGLEQTSKSTSKFQKGIGTASKVAAGALGLVAVAAIDAGKAAAEDAQGQAILANTMRKTTGATSAQIASTEDWISSMAAATGVADDQLRPALGDLMRATGDVEKSQDALKVAMDVSAATGKPLESVTKAMAKGFGGSATSLGKLVPGMDKATLKAGDMTAIMAELAAKTGGAAAAAADTAAGKMQRASLAMDEAKESIGAGLLPVMAQLATMLGTVGKFAQDHPKLFQAVAIAVAALAAAILVLNVAMTIYTAIQTAAAAATWATLLPILAIVAGVALLAVGIVLLWKRSQTFRTIVLAAFAAVKAAAQVVARVVVAIWRVVWAVLSGYVRVYVTIFRVAFTVLVAVARAVASSVSAAWRGVLAAVRAVASGIKSAWSAVWASVKSGAAAAGRVLTAPFDAVKRAIESVINAVESLISKLRNIKVPKISLPSLPGLGRAAPATVRAAPTRLARGGVGAAPLAASSGGSGTTINLYGVIDAPDAARRIRSLLRDDERRRRGVQVTSSGGRSWQPA